MPSSLWPNSATRKMYGQAGKALDRQRKSFSEHLNETLKSERLKSQSEVEAIKQKVAAYQALPWYKKLWIAVLELFARKKEIL